MTKWKTGEVQDSTYMTKTSEVPTGRWGMKAMAARIKELAEVDDVLVIGIDFGTTFSGAAWATLDDFENNEINVITSWPDHGRDEAKAPSKLLYEDGKVTWGFGVPGDADPIRWFKLLLLREEDLSDEVRQSEFVLRARKMLRETGKSATDLVADYLKGLWQHTLETIYKTRTETVVDAYIFNVVVTVPAIWKGYARDAMEEAFEKAGILEDRPAGATTLAFAPEPEAAALVTLCEQEKYMKPDDVYLICDAGGGTVDLITYRVGSVEPIQIHEAVVGTGGLCGGIFVDEAFEAICKNRLGRRWGNLSQTGINSIMKTEWEDSIKAGYKPRDDGREFIVPIPAEAFKGGSINDTSRSPVIKNARIHFSSSDIEKAFTSVFSDIEKLVDEQIRSANEKGLSVKKIILVGGLGSSPYLYDHLRSRYVRHRIDIMQANGMRPRTAICRGAVVKGFLDAPHATGATDAPLSVVSTIARQSLGVVYATEYDEAVHLARDRYWDNHEGIWRASKQMEWYLRKGDDVLKARPVRHDFYRSYKSEDEFDDMITTIIMQCDDNDPPSRHNTSVKELCRIHVSLEGISYSSLESYKGENGQALKKFSYDLEMVPSGASTEFAVWYQGRKLGSGQADVHFK
ncbi:hypothetical protein PENCOP_c001G01352 [Penicillium coprophilum]|uniref:Actin-like ATPase domain-containing protein n=1 Tax=Penicillium coprophilum TaxID=36646 RepID=A0A1V6V9B3_9EURO|nr:hypothetical protein PENCOP_c001G01352 [Penicillium coprophilum]